jgi:hypothetical protein
MRIFLRFALILAIAALIRPAVAQAPQGTMEHGPVPAPVVPAPNVPPKNPVILEWTPPEFEQLTAQASSKTSFTFDHSMLSAGAALMAGDDQDVRQAVDKVDGLSVHLLKFGPGGIPSETSVDAMRSAYHLRGWKHLVTSGGAGGPVHDGTTDVWLVFDGVTMRGAVVMVETARSLSLYTMTGNMSLTDILHLRGHFGIPNFDAKGFKQDDNR